MYQSSWCRLWNPTFQCTSLFGLAIIYLRESPKSKMTRVKHNCASLCIIVKQRITKTWFIMRHRDKHKTVFLRSRRLEKIRTNETYLHKSWYVKHGLYCNLVYYKWQRHGQRNPTKKHRLESHNLTSLLGVT